MSTVYVEGYQSALSIRETEKAIRLIKDTFQQRLSKALNLEYISAPLFLRKGRGLNDDLNGVERKVHFDLKELEGEYEIVQSLAKWKRYALYKYGFAVGEGLYTNMNAIRRDDDMDNIHSVYVDQWDWCKVISKEQRNEAYLKETVKTIVGAIADTQEDVQKVFPALKNKIKREVHFITTQALEDKYPDLTPKQREKEETKQFGTVFIMQIGGKLKSGIKHDGRAPDYDDWTLNGDLLFWNPVLEEQIEISSMGIRVDAESLEKQLKAEGKEEKLSMEFHSGIYEGRFPLTIGGGIGQSRLCVLLLEKLHIGEVQCCVWQPEVKAECKKRGIQLL
ncbi:MAG: aspartate--ammonia ligase [Clostridia bacterium]|nr:aspartate--ammonia ligase [Clostridia bacterium]